MYVKKKRNGNWPELKTEIRPLDLSEFLTFQTYSFYSDILENHKVISFHTKDEIVTIDHNILHALMVSELQNKLFVQSEKLSIVSCHMVNK